MYNERFKEKIIDWIYGIDSIIANRKFNKITKKLKQYQAYYDTNPDQYIKDFVKDVLR